MGFLEDNENSEKFTKEVRVTQEIDLNSWNKRISAARTFLSKNKIVKISIRFKESNVENAKNILFKFSQELSDISLIKKQPEIEKKNVIMILTLKNDIEAND